jgi:hypothetical protein
MPKTLHPSVTWLPVRSPRSIPNEQSATGGPGAHRLGRKVKKSDFCQVFFWENCRVLARDSRLNRCLAAIVATGSATPPGLAPQAVARCQQSRRPSRGPQRTRWHTTNRGPPMLTPRPPPGVQGTNTSRRGAELRADQLTMAHWHLPPAFPASRVEPEMPAEPACL